MGINIYTKCFITLICCGWAYGSTLTLLRLCRSGVDFREIELSPSPCDVVISWLRLQTHLECIPHPCHMYTKCFSTLVCCGWAYGSTLTLLRLCRSGVDFRKIELSPSPSDVVMTHVMVEAPNPLGVHPTCHMYTKCFITLISCGWAYECTLSTLLHLWRSGVYIGKLAWLSWSDADMSWLRLQTPVKCILHPYHIHMYTKCFSTLICCGWAYESTPTLLRLCNKWGEILGKLGYG